MLSQIAAYFSVRWNAKSSIKGRSSSRSKDSGNRYRSSSRRRELRSNGERDDEDEEDMVRPRGCLGRSVSMEWGTAQSHRRHRTTSTEYLNSIEPVRGARSVAELNQAEDEVHAEYLSTRPDVGVVEAAPSQQRNGYYHLNGNGTAAGEPSAWDNEFRRPSHEMRLTRNDGRMNGIITDPCINGAADVSGYSIEALGDPAALISNGYSSTKRSSDKNRLVKVTAIELRHIYIVHFIFHSIYTLQYA